MNASFQGQASAFVLARAVMMRCVKQQKIVEKGYTYVVNLGV